MSDDMERDCREYARQDQSHDHPVWAEIIEAIQRATIVEDSPSDDFSNGYDEGYADGLQRAADIVQILANGLTPGVTADDDDEPAFEDDGFSEQLKASS